jgi:uncharacterized SAM-binding protein YcdF (DUF218 family)
MHEFKQWVGSFATPLMISLVTSAVAGLCRTRGRRRLALWLLISALAIVYIGSLVPVGEALLAPLERRYPPLADDAQLQGVAYVVVLGSAYTPRNGISVTSALSEDALVRIVEGVRLARHMGNVRLVVSGGAAPGATPVAYGYAELARQLGIADASLVLLDRPLDTDEEAHTVKSILGTAPFLLVTSAYHMPRAVRLMQQVGAHPIPVPTGQHVGDSPGTAWRPTWAGLRDSTLALHEYVGLAALAIGFS